MSINKIMIFLQITLFLIVTNAIANNNIPDYIEMNTKEYTEHTKELVRFSHKKHTTEYSITCGECHHDSNGKTLNIKEGDDVDKCVVCHTNTGKLPKDKSLTKKEKIAMYHKEAVHSACKKCHRNVNKKVEEGLKIAPTGCKDCHKKK